jgi:ABC-type Fe3+/spermidine/putrescine transport system ATPase subunit
VLDKGKIQQCGAPRDVYKTPVSKFVANFIGETNFLDATVASAGDEIILKTPIGNIISTHRPAEPVKTGDRVTVSVRPEVIHVGYNAPPDAGNVFDAAVHDTIYLGEMAQHEINILNGQDPAAQNIKLVAYDMNPKIVAIDQQQHMAKIWFRKNNVVVLTR